MIRLASTSITEPSAPPTDPQVLASVLKAAADPLRLEILRVLAQDSFAVNELADVFNSGQSGMSHHLKVLTKSNLIRSRREGNSIFYRRAPATGSDTLGALRHQLHQEVDAIILRAELQAGLERVHHNRREASAAFFAQNANQFRQKQDLIADYQSYCETFKEIVAESTPRIRQRLVELGPGQGETLLDMAPLFNEVLAIDQSAAMLSLAKTRCESAGFKGIRFIEGDNRSPEFLNSAANCIVVNMVLHHTDSPAQVIRDCAHALAKDGVLIITELCRHQQPWVKEHCGDLWFGFDAEELHGWALNAGLRHSNGQFIALRNGFQIQIHTYHHLQPIRGSHSFTRSEA